MRLPSSRHFSLHSRLSSARILQYLQVWAACSRSLGARKVSTYRASCTHTPTHTSTHTNTHRLKHSSQTTHWLHIWTHVLCFTAPLWAAGRWSLSGTAARSPASCASPGWSRTCQSARPEPIASRDRSTSKGRRRTGSEGRVFSELTCLWLYVFLCSSQKLF